MAVKRIVTNIKTNDPAKAARFYGEILGLDLLMDMSWIATYGTQTKSKHQISFAREGGGGTPLPDITLEVDNLEKVLKKLQSAGIRIEYGPADEPWGVRRFFVTDPFGRLINIMSHR
jgi:catechol 2,3-dioxygenase-like lactoylglutathione lyase family enzyme